VEILSPHFRTNEMNQLRQRRHTPWAATTVCPGKRAFFFLEDGAEPGVKILGRVAQIGLTGKKKVPKLGEMC
jgi:hypothetical protein